MLIKETLILILFFGEEEGKGEGRERLFFLFNINSLEAFFLLFLLF